MFGEFGDLRIMVPLHGYPFSNNHGSEKDGSFGDHTIFHFYWSMFKGLKSNHRTPVFSKNTILLWKGFRSKMRKTVCLSPKGFFCVVNFTFEKPLAPCNTSSTLLSWTHKGSVSGDMSAKTGLFSSWLFGTWAQKYTLLQTNMAMENHHSM